MLRPRCGQSEPVSVISVCSEVLGGVLVCLRSCAAKAFKGAPPEILAVLTWKDMGFGCGEVRSPVDRLALGIGESER